MRIDIVFSNKYLFALLFAGITTCITAQNATLKGTITDVETNETLIGVTIKAGNTTGTVSNTDGQYSLSLPPGVYEMSFAITGYNTHSETVRLTAGAEKTLDFSMSSSNNLLQQTTVTAGKFEKPLGEVTVSLDIIKPRLIESINATAVDQVLTKVPGVTILDGQISIRGGAGFSYGAGTRVLVLMDDIPALQVDAGLPNWNDFAVENCSQIEILKGAASALYGSSAMNGIVNFRTDYAKDKPETNFSIFGKTWGDPADERSKWWGTDSSEIQRPLETGISLSHRRKIGRLDFVASAYGLFRDSYNRYTYSRYGRVSPNIRYRINDRTSLVVNSNFNFGKSGSFFIWGNDSTGAYQADPTSVSKTLGRLRFTIDPSLQHFDRAGNRHKLLSRYYQISNNNDGGQSNFSRMFYGEYQFQNQLRRFNLVTTAGVVGILTNVDSELYGNERFVNKNLAAYIQMDWKPLPRLNLSGGVRYESNVQISPDTIYSINNEFSVIPDGRTEEARPVFRIGANYQLGKATYLRASWGQGYRYPTIAEKFINTSFSAINRVVPNTALFSETGWSAELAVKQGFKLGTWQGFMDISVFQQEYRNMMEFVLTGVTILPNPNPPPTTQIAALFQSRNQGGTRVKGFEVSVMGQGQLGPGKLSLLAGFTGLDPQYKIFNYETERFWGSSDTSKNVLKYRFKRTFKLDTEYALKKISAGVSVQYNSNMDAIDGIFELFLPGVKSFRQSHNKGFTLLDLRAAYRITSKIKVSMIAGNVLNTVYSYRPALLEGPKNYTVRLDWSF